MSSEVEIGIETDLAETFPVPLVVTNATETSILGPSSILVDPFEELVWVGSDTVSECPSLPHS